MKKAISMFVLLLAAQVASATPTLLQFTNADVDLGLGSVIPVTTEYLGFGIGLVDAYRYIDGRDPFTDSPNDVPSPCPNENANGRCNFGLSNNADTAIMVFAVPTSSLAFNWWTITDGSYWAFDSSFNVLDSFSATAGSFGTQSVVGPVSYLAWSGSPGFVSVSDIAFDTVPEPSTMLLLGAGLFGAAVTRRRRH